jgi:hypothetical protein
VQLPELYQGKPTLLWGHAPLLYRRGWMEGYLEVAVFGMFDRCLYQPVALRAGKHVGAQEGCAREAQVQAPAALDSALPAAAQLHSLPHLVHSSEWGVAVWCVRYTTHFVGTHLCGPCRGSITSCLATGYPPCTDNVQLNAAKQVYCHSTYRILLQILGQPRDVPLLLARSPILPANHRARLTGTARWCVMWHLVASWVLAHHQV